MDEEPEFDDDADECEECGSKTDPLIFAWGQRLCYRCLDEIEEDMEEQDASE